MQGVLGPGVLGPSKSNEVAFGAVTWNEGSTPSSSGSSSIKAAAMQMAWGPGQAVTACGHLLAA